MKKGRFLWSAYRITEKQKAGKARNIKEKQLKNSRSTVSRQLVALRSSPRDNFPFGIFSTGYFIKVKHLRTVYGSEVFCFLPKIMRLPSGIFDKNMLRYR